MSVYIKARNLALDVPIFLQNERAVGGWAGMFLGAAFDPPRRSLVRLLDGIDLDINEGDRLAILGRNGAGKSTLLRVLNRVYQPTSGEFELRGSCQALLNMSLGFNGEATVRENIFLRGVAMGLRSNFLKSQIEPILDFSGLHEKVNHRLRTLSSGQKMRLGFAISTSVQHDIVLMDEWVGAGDADFMAKAKARMASRVGGSKIVVLASHSVGLLRDICNKGIVLERGRLMHVGDIASSLTYYHQLLAQPSSESRGDHSVPDTDGAASVYGAIDAVSELGGGRFALRGWMVDSKGLPVHGLVLESKGMRYPVRILSSVDRPDVNRHFGLGPVRCGFLGEIRIDGVERLSGLGGSLRALGGAVPEHAYAPLRLSPAVLALLQPH